MTAAGPAVVIAGGGTGGHLFPGLALADELVARGCAVTFVGTAAGIEAREVPAAGYPLRLVPGRQLRGGGPVRAAAGLVAAVQGALHCRALLGELRPQLVVGVGGYASVAAVLAARLRGTPTILLEQNAIPGAANRLLGRIARRVCVGFEATVARFPPGRAVHTGNPIRGSILAGSVRPPGAPPGILVFGGSQGAHRLNAAMLDAARLLGPAAQRLTIVHQTGRDDVDEVRRGYAALGITARVEPFITDMAAAYASADVALSRAGAMSCAELTAVGLPSILVPYPHAADDHQRFNAQILVDAGAAHMILDHDLTGDRLAASLAPLLADPSRRAAMAAAARNLGRPQAAQHVADEALALLRP